MEKMKSLRDYIEQAEELILKHSGPHMLSDDNVSDIINTITRIENEYDPNHPTGASFNTYLNTSVRLRIMTLATKEKKRWQKSGISICQELARNASGDSFTLQDIIQCKRPRQCQSSWKELEEKLRINLGERDSQIFIDRFVYGHTLEEIGKNFKISKQRVAQIIQQCIWTLRKCSYMNKHME